MTQHNRETLLALADRFEKAAGESFDLFAESFDAIHGGRSSERLLWSQFCALIEAGAWLDAARSLVPEGDYDFDLAKTSRGGDMFKLWQCRINLETVEQDPDETSPVALGEAHTPALAVSAAALRASATLDPTGEKA